MAVPRRLRRRQKHGSVVAKSGLIPRIPGCTARWYLQPGSPQIDGGTAWCYSEYLPCDSGQSLRPQTSKNGERMSQAAHLSSIVREIKQVWSD